MAVEFSNLHKIIWEEAYVGEPEKVRFNFQKQNCNFKVTLSNIEKLL